MHEVKPVLAHHHGVRGRRGASSASPLFRGTMGAGRGQTCHQDAAAPSASLSPGPCRQRALKPVGVGCPYWLTVQEPGCLSWALREDVRVTSAPLQFPAHEHLPTWLFTLSAHTKRAGSAYPGWQ